MPVSIYYYAYTFGRGLTIPYIYYFAFFLALLLSFIFVQEDTVLLLKKHPYNCLSDQEESQFLLLQKRFPKTFYGKINYT